MTDLSERLYNFALKIVQLVRVLPKEAKETNFWLRILRDSKIIGESSLKGLIAESDEIQKILAKSVKTLKDKN